MKNGLLLSTFIIGLGIFLCIALHCAPMKGVSIFVVAISISALAFGQTIGLQSGDLLFVGSGESALSEAIDEVTQTGADQHYVHVALVEIIKDSTWIIHADSEEGVIKESLQAFTADRPLVDGYRIENLSNKQIQSALELAQQQIGQPYNFSYVMSDSGYYCSELIYDAFEADSVFGLEPMTFKDPESKTFHQGWIDHFKKLGIPIPEDKPGCNPNGMAADEDLILLGRL